MHMEWSEEKFLKGIVGDKRRLRFRDEHQKMKLVFTQLARYMMMIAFIITLGEMM